jgi:uncharacterized protein
MTVSKGMAVAMNVLGQPLQACSHDPVTGFYRTGCCETGTDDLGLHVICAQMTQEFLDYTRANGNDLSVAYAGFPGLKVGDRWCLCAARWLEAQQADVAPHVILASTHEAALEVVSLDLLKAHALDYAVN